MAPVRLLLDVSAVPARPVGAGVYTVELARELAARDVTDLHLVTRQADTARWSDLAPKATLHPEVPEPRPRRLRLGADRRAPPRRPASAPTSGTARTTRCRCGSGSRAWSRCTT